MVEAPKRLLAPVPEPSVDHLKNPKSGVQVLLLADHAYPEDSDCGFRRPHRHDRHEFIWSRRGTGGHLIDGQHSMVEAATVTVIRRGQVHVFEQAAGLGGALVRFGAEMLTVDFMARANPWWLAGCQGPHAVTVPERDVARLDALIASMSEETSHPPDSRSFDVQCHLLGTMLLWVERWHDAMQTESRDGDDESLQLYRRFVDLLERGYAHHHEARDYAERLKIPQSVLSRALAEVSGRRTKELITHRRMLEAERLLRFSHTTIGEVASRSGFADQLYFSRAFKRYHGVTPTEYRNQVRGR